MLNLDIKTLPPEVIISMQQVATNIYNQSITNTAAAQQQGAQSNA